MSQLLTVSLRQKAVFIAETAWIGKKNPITPTAALLVANLASLGFGVSEDLMNALSGTSISFQVTLLNKLRDVMGVNKNWTPLVKDWSEPTGETELDHIVTLFANVFNHTEGTLLPCGHIIPDNTFPLERYNGCPFCGTTFQFGELEKVKQGSEQKVLDLWTMDNVAAFLKDLLTSKTALDATQMDSLKILLTELPMPAVKPAMKETLVAVVDIYIQQGEPQKAQSLFTSPVDVMRYLWYKHTGFLQIIEPRTITNRKSANSKHRLWLKDKGASAALNTKAGLQLKYNRKECLMVASWLNNMPLDAEKMCEMMHPKRGMWVRFIRALRLAEYSHRKGFEKLEQLLDKFYKQDYEVWQGFVNHYRLRYDASSTLALLQQRPGLFARSLFANMLWFGSDETIAAFAEIIDKVPARLVFTLNMYADNYFDATNNRTVKPLGGINKNIPANRMLQMHTTDQLDAMKAAVTDLCILVVKKRFAAVKNNSKTIYIDPMLFKMPVSIGDRSDTIQDLPSALMGTRFAVQGDTVRLFMQWGAGLPAQHMDMDLSCVIAYENTSEHCSFSSLVAIGCKHSGDIRSIPYQVGTAEYIDIDLAALKMAKANYVTFTCNAYSAGSITPNLVVGWMNSQYPMTISEKTGVAYDPSCVQHQVRITSGLTKGLVFGVLDVAASEIVWLEVAFQGQLVQNLDARNIESMLKKLNSKLTVGGLLQIKAEAQQLTMTETPEADEVYTATWATNTAAVTKLLID